MKICTKCNIEKPLSEFYKNKTKKDGLTSYCKDCKRIYNEDHYNKTKEVWKDSRADSRRDISRRNQDWVINYLNDHPCVDCDIDDIRVLEFDHLSDKVANVANLMTGSLEKLQIEIAKCEVRCRNCHVIKTYERMGTTWKLEAFKALR